MRLHLKAFIAEIAENGGAEVAEDSADYFL
jgi:hypothetical protein